MKKLWIVGVVLLVLFEAANVYFIMPLPGSQRMRSLDAAYQVYQWRWAVRALALALIAAGLAALWRLGGWGRVATGAALAGVAVFAYVVNFRMAADQMFRQPRTLRMVPSSENEVKLDRLVVGVEVDGEARAYPLQYIGYHHQVRDSIAGQAILVSYCTVCRTGRVFSPVVNGRPETFRLVGMDHWNAMFEDASTGSWWRQANGEAVTGPLEGSVMREVPSLQVTLAQWLAMHPTSLVMQADSAFLDEYAKDYSFERGTSRKSLTGTDTTSWGEKSWVIGITSGGASMAYDWNALKRSRVIHGMVGDTPIVIALASDTSSFFAFVRPTPADTFTVRGDSLVSSSGATFSIDGKGATGRLAPIKASQEFWHSWRTFQPATGKGS
jgi:hypothetical protein